MKKLKLEIRKREERGEALKGAIAACLPRIALKDRSSDRNRKCRIFTKVVVYNIEETG